MDEQYATKGLAMGKGASSASDVSSNNSPGLDPERMVVIGMIETFEPLITTLSTPVVLCTEASMPTVPLTAGSMINVP